MSKVDKIKNLIIDNEIKNIVLLAGLVGDPITKNIKNFQLKIMKKNIIFYFKAKNIILKGLYLFQHVLIMVSPKRILCLMKTHCSNLYLYMQKAKLK